MIYHELPEVHEYGEEGPTREDSRAGGQCFGVSLRWGHTSSRWPEINAEGGTDRGPGTARQKPLPTGFWIFAAGNVGAKPLTADAADRTDKRGLGKKLNREWTNGRMGEGAALQDLGPDLPGFPGLPLSRAGLGSGHDKCPRLQLGCQTRAGVRKLPAVPACPPAAGGAGLPAGQEPGDKGLSLLSGV